MPSGQEQLKLNQDGIAQKINISTVNLRSFRSSPADGVQAMMTARVRQLSAFIDIGATEAVVRQLISGAALTVKRSDRVVAGAIDAGRIETLVDVVAIKLVEAEHEAAGTGALVGSFGVNAYVRAVV